MRITILAFLLLFSGFAIGQEKQGDREQTRKERFERMEAIKVAYITKEINLSVEESQVFWPVYNKYQAQLKELRESVRPKDKGELTEAEADELIDKFITGEYEKAKIHESMTNELKPIIGSVRVVKLAKVEQKFKREVLNRSRKKRDRDKQKGHRKRR